MEREERRFIEEGKPQQRSSLPGIRQSGRAPCPQFGQMAARTETSAGKPAISEPCAWTEPASREEESQRKGATEPRKVPHCGRVRGACSRFGCPIAFNSGSKLHALQTLCDQARAKNPRSLRATWTIGPQRSNGAEEFSEAFVSRAPARPR